MLDTIISRNATTYFNVSLILTYNNNITAELRTVSNGQDIKFTGNNSVEGEFPDRHPISNKIDFFVKAYEATNKSNQ
jgi:hypothetical protein